MSASTLLTGAKRTALNALSADAREFYEERAAILEYEAGISRLEAEVRALELTYRWFGLRSCPQDGAAWASGTSRRRSADGCKD